MATDIGGNANRSANEPVKSTEPPSTRPSFATGRGIAIGVALGVVVAAVFTISSGHSVVFVAATGSVTVAGGYVLAQATGVLERIRTATRNAERYEFARRMEIVAWLQRLIDLATDRTKFWNQYPTRNETWRTDVDRFTKNVASFHDLAVTNALSCISAHLATEQSFEIESNDAFAGALTELAGTAIRAAKRVRPRFWTTVAFEHRLTANQIRSVVGQLTAGPSQINNPGQGGSIS